MSRIVVLLLAGALALLAAAPARADVVDDDPAIAAVGVGDMRMFVRGTDGAVWTRSWNGSSWSGWSSLGGVATSGPVAITRGNIYDVFVRGGDNAYYHKYFTPAAGWYPSWERIGGAFSSAPGASLRQGTGEIDVVGVGTDGQLHHGYWAAGSGWSAFGALGGGLSGRPSSVSPAAGIIDVYLRGTDHQLYQKSWISGSGWTNFANLGGSLTSGVSATAWDGNRRDVFVRGPGNLVYDDSFQTPNWVGFSALDVPVSSAPGATSISPGRLALVARSGSVIAYRSFAGTWTPWQNLGRAPLYKEPVPPLTASELRLRAGLGCIPRGNRVPVSIKVHKRAGRKKPRIIKVLFFVDRGKHKRTDRKKPYKARIRVTYKKGSKHRVHARIYYRRPGQRRVHRKTVSKRFTMCK
jgi:hypothetical protein